MTHFPRSHWASDTLNTIQIGFAELSRRSWPGIHLENLFGLCWIPKHWAQIVNLAFGTWHNWNLGLGRDLTCNWLQCHHIKLQLVFLYPYHASRRSFFNNTQEIHSPVSIKSNRSWKSLLLVFWDLNCSITEEPCKCGFHVRPPEKCLPCGWGWSHANEHFPFSMITFTLLGRQLKSKQWWETKR